MTSGRGSPYPVTNDRTSLAWRFAAAADDTAQQILDRVMADPGLGKHITPTLEELIKPSIRESVAVNSQVLTDGRTPPPAGTERIVALAVGQGVELESLQRGYRIAYAVQLEVCVELIAQMPMQERDRRPLMREALDLLLRAELERTKVVSALYADRTQQA